MRRLFLIIFIIYTVLVSYLCLSAPTGITNLGSWDKIAHILTYIGFAIQGSLITKSRKQYFLLLALCAIYGIAIEYLQSLTGYRIASLNDELANIAGLFIGLIVSKIVDHFFPLAAFKKSQ